MKLKKTCLIGCIIILTVLLLQSERSLGVILNRKELRDSYTAPSIAFNPKEIKVLIFGRPMVTPDNEPKPFANKDNRIMVTVRYVAEGLGYEVNWNQEYYQAIIKGRNKAITIPVGANYAYLNDEKIIFDTNSFIYEGRTFVPLRFVSEALGYEVEWLSEDYAVNISMPR